VNATPVEAAAVLLKEKFTLAVLVLIAWAFWF
jgi:hypothetical protein